MQSWVFFCSQSFILFANILFIVNVAVHAKSALWECDIVFFLGVMSHLHFLNKTGLIEAI